MADCSLGKAYPDDNQLAYHLSLLKLESHEEQLAEASLAPVFTSHVFRRFSDLSLPTPAAEVSQYGLLAGITKANGSDHEALEDKSTWEKDPRLFFNVSSPSSIFICGSQGSGKSHTLSCILESCLIPSKAGRLLKPLTAVVFHYDTFISDNSGSPCEAAFLASNPQIKVRVLCAPTNLRNIKVMHFFRSDSTDIRSCSQGTYSRFKIKVEALRIDQADLNTKRMLDLMAVGQDNGPLPLYMHTVQRILREMRIEQQSLGTDFDYVKFKDRVVESGLTPAQLEPLKQRLDSLESFMPPEQAFGSFGKKPKGKRWGSDWRPQYMDNSVEAQSFTQSLLSTVRLQRHLGIRIVISTQEPTISTALLGLCSVTVVHRFSSPEWLRTLKSHIAGVSLGEEVSRESSAGGERRMMWEKSLFERIVRLRVGEAFLFSPSAVIGNPAGRGIDGIVQKLGPGYLEVKIRSRLTEDGGKSVVSS
ncbi:hypothetical protein N7520_001909 [Penicillium odoratum]|uniref:uncharacterized protein n=1 Tax=Penicillium odoratum TaxID=1167516 RepID=UPI0025496DF1|nr:uncharacterized protein N7520_001909 [Penicillium odoratum]KAJ5778663.1 hypothetical protein N7520_001909 [Penicillium odoratum]